jgi:hypothetical protein
MRFMYLLFLFVPLLLCGACKDTPRYTADQVIVVAKSYSPGPCACQSILSLMKRPYGKSEPQEKDEPIEPSWYIEYIGKGMWCVEKDCCGRYAYFFLFYEDTGKLVKQSQSCRP